MKQASFLNIFTAALMTGALLISPAQAQTVLKNVQTASSGSNTDNAVLRWDGVYAQAQNSAVTIGDTGNIVGSGPLNALNVAAGITPFVELEVDSTSTSSPRGIMTAQFNTGTDGARFHMRKARGTRASPTTVVTGDNLGRLVATGYDGSNYLEMGSIIFGTEGTIAATRIPTNLSFWTATDAAPSVLTQRLTINSAGLVTVADDLTISGGNLAVGGAIDTTVGIYLRGNANLTGVLQYALLSTFTFSSAATTAGVSGYFDVKTAAASYTMTDAIAVRAGTPTVGSGSAIATSTGISVANMGATGVTNAYGVDIAAQSGAATINVGMRNAGTTLLTNVTESTSSTSGSLQVSGGIGVAKNVVAAGFFAGTPTTRTGSGAISVVSNDTLVDSTGGGALTLANGTVNGQTKTIKMVVDGGDATITPDGTKTGWTTIVLDAVGDSVVLKWYTTYGWMVESNYNSTVNP